MQPKALRRKASIMETMGTATAVRKDRGEWPIPYVWQGCLDRISPVFGVRRDSFDSPDRGRDHSDHAIHSCWPSSCFTRGADGE